MNVFGMCSCALMIKYFKMATVAMITMKVEKILFLSDCNETSQEWSLGCEDVHSRLKIIIIIIIIIII